MTQPPRTRLTPDERRSQLLDLGVRLFARRSLHEISIDLLAETAGISRGLLYHYFGNIVAFQEAVVRRAADDLLARTAPPREGDLLERLLASVEAYVDFVDDNYEGYLSMVRGAKSGNETLAQIYEEARSALTDRIFAEGAAELVPDTAAARLLVRGWQAMTEELVLTWKGDPDPAVRREELLTMVTASLPAVMTTLPEAQPPRTGA